MNCERCGYELLDGEKRLHRECGCDFCGTVEKHELWVPRCHVAVCHNENEKRIADAVSAKVSKKRRHNYPMTQDAKSEWAVAISWALAAYIPKWPKKPTKRQSEAQDFYQWWLWDLDYHLWY